MYFDFIGYGQDEESNIKKIRALNWPALNKLWKQIKTDKKGQAPGWNAGKALEYMIMRAFELEKAEVAYPYTNIIINSEEQFDGYVFLKSLGVGFLFECKDWNKKASFDQLAKLHGRLSYRPSTTFGVFVSKNGFTPSAMELMYMQHPHNILLWSKDEIEECFKHHKFTIALTRKYQYAMMTADCNLTVMDGINI